MKNKRCSELTNRDEQARPPSYLRFRSSIAPRARHRTFTPVKVPCKIPKGFHLDRGKEPVALKRGDGRLQRRQEGLAGVICNSEQ